MTYLTIPVRIYLPDGAVHVIERIGLSAAVAEYPQALRVERADVEPLPACVGCKQIAGMFY